MPMFTIFENAGEIDPRAISTFGVSVKETANPIGFFGTGLKYAIAVLLRHQHAVTILSGAQRIEFGVARDTLRGQEFEFVTMSIINRSKPKEIGFTTALGKGWELWMAYRELACNAKDEPAGKAFLAQKAPKCSPGVTRVLVEGEAFAALHTQRHEFLLEDEPQLTLDAIEVRTRPSADFFYRGVRIQRLERAALFTYNDLHHCDLTEDRTLKHAWQSAHHVAMAWLRCEDPALLRRVLTAEENTFEHGLDFHGWNITPSAAFLSVMTALVGDNVARVNQSALKTWREKTQQQIAPREVALSTLQRAALERALDFCDRMGFPVRGSYPVAVVEALGKGVLGLAYQEKIYLSERAFDLGGAKQVASTLIEEYIHLRHGLTDCSRELQSFLFERLVSVGEALHGEAL